MAASAFERTDDLAQGTILLTAKTATVQYVPCPFGMARAALSLGIGQQAVRGRHEVLAAGARPI